MQPRYAILVADDHSIVRTGISLILKDAIEGAEVSHAQDFEAAVAILEKSPFDLLLLDIDLPGGNSVNMIPRVKSVDAKVKILMFSASDEDTYALRYLRAGANGYVNKLSPDGEIVAAVKAVLTSGEYITARIRQAAKTNVDNPLSILSKREYEIMSLLISGEGNLEIANNLDIQMSTVSTYKKRIYEKLGINNVPSLIEVFKRYHES